MARIKRSVYLIFLSISTLALLYALVTEYFPESTTAKITLSTLGIVANIAQVIGFAQEQTTGSEILEGMRKLLEKSKIETLEKMKPTELIELLVAQYEQQKEKAKKASLLKRIRDTLNYIQSDKTSLFWAGVLVLGFAIVELFSILWFATFPDALCGLSFSDWKKFTPWLFAGIVFLFISICMMRSGFRKKTS